MLITLVVVALASLSFVSAAGISTDGTCGGSKGFTCLNSAYGNCCSSHGWCGSTIDYCATGCQSGYGTCNTSPQPSSQPKTVSPDGTCGSSKGYTCPNSAYGSCCSQYNYCGGTSAYCASGCQPAFGNCNGISSSSTRRSTLSTSTQESSTRSTTPVTSGTPSAQPVSTNARCGPQFGGHTCLGSQWGNCCSSFSYCGSTLDYCAPANCQAGYGLCNFVSSSSSSLRTSISTQAASSVPGSQVSSTATMWSSTTPSLVMFSSTTSSPPISSTVASSSPSMDSSSIPAASSTQSPDTLTDTSSGGTILSSTTITYDIVSTSTTPTSTPSSSCIQQLVVNGDFDTGSLSPWNTYHANPSDNSQFSVVTDDTTSNYAFLYQSTTGDSSHIRQTLTNLPTGSTVSCSFKYRTLGTFNTIRAQISMNGVTCGDSNGEPQSTSYQTVTGTAVTNLDNPEALVAFDYSATSAISLYIDEVSICVMSSNAEPLSSSSSSTQPPTTDAISSPSVSAQASPTDLSTKSVSSTTLSTTQSSDRPSTMTTSSSALDRSMSTPSSSPSDSSMSSSTSSAATCTSTLAYTAPADATCFTVTSHGSSQIEGKLLGARARSVSPAFGFAGFTTSTFSIDSNGYVTMASSVNNGWVMMNAGGAPDYMSFYPVSAATATYQKVVCGMDLATKAFHCCLGRTCDIYGVNLPSPYTAKDSRTNVVRYGASSGYTTPITMTYDVVPCPQAC